MSEGCVITTERLVLSPCRDEDVDALHAHWTDAEVRRFLWDDVVVERPRVAEVVAKSHRLFDVKSYGLWLCREPGEDALLGVVALWDVEETLDVELLYSLAPGAWGNGYATEAGSAVLEYGFETLGLDRIVADTDLPNQASKRVLERLGMVYFGYYARDGLPLHSFAMTSMDYRRASAAKAGK